MGDRDSIRMDIAVKKIGVSFQGPNLVLVYSSNGITRKRNMPIRDLTANSDCNAVANTIKRRHSKYLDSVSDIMIEKLVMLAKENLRGATLKEGLSSVEVYMKIDPEEDLNKLTDNELKKKKQIMDLTFNKNSVVKDHPDFIYDKRVEFNPNGGKGDWDSDNDNDEDDKIEAQVLSLNEGEDSDDFW